MRFIALHYGYPQDHFLPMGILALQILAQRQFSTNSNDVTGKISILLRTFSFEDLRAEEKLYKFKLNWNS